MFLQLTDEDTLEDRRKQLVCGIFLLFDCNMLECCYRRLLHYIFKDFCDSFQNVGFDVVVVYHF